MHKTVTIVFDLDGTLIDSAPDLTEALNRVLHEQDLPPVTTAAVRHMVGDGAVKMIERGFAAAGRPWDDGLSLTLRNSFFAHYEDCMTDNTVTFDGVTKALEALSNAGFRLAICTNKPVAMSEVILARLGLNRFFASVLGGDSLAVRKPDPAHLLEAIGRAGGNRDAAVMVGDSTTDVRAARNARVPVVAVSFGYTRIAPAELGADALIDHFDELLPALSGMLVP
ncbi:MAG TPA: phosphoglycolate phosphatase [Alphaproteobacteria bacterium]|jgi:phosphoglycolate phosphatase|nr:phosphoglycolate phosphatase [Alphaproteobacteria bacterium]